MVYEKRTERLEPHELAPLALRRNLELAMASALAGSVAVAVGLPIRFDGRLSLSLMFAIPLALALLSETLLVWRWRSLPATAVERFARTIEKRRERGRPTGALSRGFIVAAGVAALAFSLAVVLLLPIE
jgi:uncharacterized membrane-anchored protein